MKRADNKTIVDRDYIYSFRNVFGLCNCCSNIHKIMLDILNLNW